MLSFIYGLKRDDKIIYIHLTNLLTLIIVTKIFLYVIIFIIIFIIIFVIISNLTLLYNSKLEMATNYF